MNIGNGGPNLILVLISAWWCKFSIYDGRRMEWGSYDVAPVVTILTKVTSRDFLKGTMKNKIS